MRNENIFMEDSKIDIVVLTQLLGIMMRTTDKDTQNKLMEVLTQNYYKEMEGIQVITTIINESKKMANQKVD